LIARLRFELFLVDQAFALEADLDDDIVAGEADDPRAVADRLMTRAARIGT
jgi:hypothetical protein